MASTHGSSQGEFDERLIQALNSALLVGEETVAREAGDQGQGIALTDSRILVIKAGLAATGEMNGHHVSAFPLNDVAAVNLRKGPLGAVIQVLAKESQAPTDGGRPDNIVIFTGPGRVKKAEVFAATVESMTETKVNRVDPQAKAEPVKEQPAQEQSVPKQALPEPVSSAESVPSEPPAKPSPAVEVVEEHHEVEPPKGGRVAKSLAEEIYGEIMQGGQPEPTKPVVEFRPPVEYRIEEPVPEAAAEPVVETPVVKPPVETTIAEVVEPEVEVVAEQPVEAAPEQKAKRQQKSKSKPEHRVDFDLSVPEAKTSKSEPKPEPEQEPESQPEEFGSKFNPNPRLPKPRRNKKQGPNKVLVFLGVLSSLLFVGMAIIAPLKETPAPSPVLSSDNTTNDVRKIQLQLSSMSRYKDDVVHTLGKADAEVSAFRSALASRSNSSIISCSRLSATDKAWEDVSSMQTPPGLAGARQNLLDGLVARKNAISAAAAAADVGSSVDFQRTTESLNAAEEQIKKGLSAIDAAEANLQRQIANSAPAAKGGANKGKP